MISIENCIVCWTPASYKGKGNAGAATLAPMPDRGRQSDQFIMTDGGCWAGVRNMSDDEKKALALDIYRTMTLDGINPQVAHAVMLEVREYSEAAPDRRKAANTQ